VSKQKNFLPERGDPVLEKGGVFLWVVGERKVLAKSALKAGIGGLPKRSVSLVTRNDQYIVLNDQYMV